MPCMEGGPPFHPTGLLSVGQRLPVSRGNYPLDYILPYLEYLTPLGRVGGHSIAMNFLCLLD